MTAHNVPIKRSWIDRLFQREEMDGDGRCATYLVRWTLLKLPRGIGVYLHHFVGDDWSRDLHDHPKRFISVGLRGSYLEETPSHDEGCWQVLADSANNEMVRVRWSVPDAFGAYFYAAHYPATSWGWNACEGQADRWNTEGKRPWEWPTSFQPIAAVNSRIYRAPWFRTFPAEHIHRIRLIDGKPCWTLVIVLATKRRWGFWHGGQFVPWRDYVNSETATRMKSCQ